MEAEDMMESSRRWLRASEVSKRNSLYGIALYSLEMAVEIALKAVLYRLGIEVPKTHDIVGQVRAVAREDKRMSEEIRNGIEPITSTFAALLEYRAPAGYSFEYNFSERELKKKLDSLYPKSKEIVEMCERMLAKNLH